MSAQQAQPERKLTPRERRRIKRINNILKQSMLILVEDGLDGLTTHRLADALDLTPGALYRYFPSKDAILAELQIRTFSELHDVFRLAWQRCETFMEGKEVSKHARVLFRIIATMRLFVDMQQVAPTRFGIISLAMREPRQLLDDQGVEPVVGVVMPVVTDVATLLHACAEAGALNAGDASSRALNAWFGLHGILLMAKFKRFAPGMFEARPRALEMIETILLGWGASREALDEAQTLITDLFGQEALLKDALEAMEAE